MYYIGFDRHSGNIFGYFGVIWKNLNVTSGVAYFGHAVAVKFQFMPDAKKFEVGMATFTKTAIFLERNEIIKDSATDHLVVL